MKQKNQFRLFISIILLIIFVFYPIIYNKTNLYNTIELIKKSYISQQKNVEELNEKYIEKIYNKKNKNSEEEFIVGYIYKSKRHFEIAYQKIKANTNKFVKYYLYNLKAKESIVDDNIHQAKIFTEKSINNVELNKDEKSHYLIWQALIPYIDLSDGKEYILRNTKKIIQQSKLDENTYMLNRYRAPILHLVGTREEAIQNIIQLIHSTQNNNDIYNEVKSTIDLANIIIDFQAYDISIDILDYAMKKSNNIENNEEKNTLQLYIYITKCKIHFINNEYKSMEVILSEIYKYKLDSKENHRDFLILAKAYESICMSEEGNLIKSEKLINEAKKLLLEDKEVLLSDKDVNINIAQSKLEYKKGNYEIAINICEELIRNLELSESSPMRILVMKELRYYYFITENINLNKLSEKIREYDDELKNDVAKLYLKNNIDKVNNIKTIKKKYDLTINVIIFCLIQFIILTILAIRYREKRRKNEILQKDIELLNNQFKYQFKHYENLKTHQEEVRILWHDMKNHVNILIGLLESDNTKELESYLYRLSDQMIKSNSNSITKNKIIDAILSSKVEACKYKNIELNIISKLPEDIGIQDVDICIILGNLIDNAIEACEKIEEGKKYINLNIGIKNSYVYIRIENSKSNTISKYEGNIITSKDDKVNHGLGLRSINKSLEKYDGSIKFNYDDTKFEVFVTMKEVD